MIPQAWTLSVELYLSILLPLFLFVIGRSVIAFVSLLVVTSVVSLWVLEGSGQFSMLLGMGVFHFMLGILLARFHDDLRLATKRSSQWIAVILIPLGLILLNFAHFGNRELEWFSPLNPLARYVPGVGAAMLLLAFSIRPSLSKPLVTPVLVYLGKISYSLYLCQLIVLFVLTPRCLLYLNQNGFEADGARVIALVISSIGVILLSDVLYRFVEKPSIQLARRLSARSVG